MLVKVVSSRLKILAIANRLDLGNILGRAACLDPAISFWRDFVSEIFVFIVVA